MGIGGGFIAAVLGALLGSAPAVSLAPSAEVEGPAVRLEALSRLETLPPQLRQAAAGLEIARFAPGQRRLVLPARELAARARADLPALTPFLPDPGPGVVVLQRTGALAARGRASSPPAATACGRMRRALAAGAAPARGDVEAAPCAATPAAWRYDARLGVARAARDLAAGETVAALPDAALASAAVGAPLYLRAGVGPVLVERMVRIVAPARAGAQVFVKAEDGAVFAVPAPQVRP